MATTWGQKSPIYNDNRSYINRFGLDIVEIGTKKYIKIIDKTNNTVYFSNEINSTYTYGVQDSLSKKIFFIKITIDKSNGKYGILIHDRVSQVGSNTLKIMESHKGEKPLQYKRLLRNHNIEIITIKDKIGCYYFKRNRIESKIKELNNKLENICSELYLQIDNREVLNGTIPRFSYNSKEALLLCLYNKSIGHCVSSIELKYEGNGEMSIDSKTHKSYTGKKYNKLLRSVIIIISSLIICHENKIKIISSEAINPISAWLLIGYFDTTYKSDPPELFNEYERKIDSTSPKSLKDKLFGFYNKYNNDGLLIKVELNDKNIKKANDLFNNLTSRNINRKNNIIKC